MKKPYGNLAAAAAVSGLRWRHWVTSHCAVDRREWQGKWRWRSEAFDALGRQQTKSSSVDAVASTAALFQLLLEVESHQVLARDDADDATGHVYNGQVPQTERAKHDVRPM